MLRSTKSRRAALLAASLATIAIESQTASAANKFFTATNGSWSNASLWSPNGVPTATDIAMVGASSLTANGNVMLDVNTTLIGLSITDGMTVQTSDHQITVNGNFTVSGDNWQGGAGSGHSSRIYLGHTFVNPYDVRANTINVADGADFILGDSIVNVMTSMSVTNNGGVYGRGIMNFYGSGTVLSVDGNFQPGIFGGPTSTFTLNQLGTGRIDLDGTVAGDNIISISGLHNAITINGDALTDSFNDQIWVRNGNSLNMNLTDGWSIGPGGGLIFLEQPADSTGKLTGGTLTMSGGWLEAIGSDSNPVVAEIDAPVVLNSGTLHVDQGKMILKKNFTMNGGEAEVFGGDYLDLDGPVVINGGKFILEDWYASATFNNSATINNGNIYAYDLSDFEFNGTTTINGGVFTTDFRGEMNFDGPTKVFGGTFNTDSSYGGIRFNGPTEYANTINILGRLHQNGTATVNQATTVNGGILDLDGEAAITNWNINAPLTLNVDGINMGNNTFTGKMTLTSTTTSPAKLAVNLPAGESWIMAGRMDLIGHGFGTATDVVSGSDVKISGLVNVSFDNAISARATFSNFNTTTINTASGLRLDGGTLLNPNRIEGATIKGAGSLKSIANRALTGYGTISSGIAFATGELRADGGVLNLNGPISSVGIIAAQPNSTLKFGMPFNTSTATRLEVNGGVVSGSSVTNASGKEIRGKGFITTAGLNNSGTLSAIGGTLAVDTTIAPDLDGSSENGRLSVAANSELYFADTPADEFNGNASVAAGGLLRFEQSFSQGNFSFINLNGTVAQPANVSAVTMNLKGNISMPSNAQGTFNAKTTFENGVSAFINPGAQLEVIQDSTINAGANFSGGGTLKNGPGVKMVLAHDAEVGVKILNTGSFEVNALFPAAASAGGFEQTSLGSTRFDVFGATPGTLHDKLTVSGAANLNGTLTLNRGLGNPAYLQSHEIISAIGGVNGTFSKIGAIEISPTKYWAVTYDADSVFATPALPGDANLDGGVNIADFALLASNFNTTGTWADGSFDGNTTVNISDFALLAGYFNQSVPADLPRGNAVPEPALGLAALSLFGLRRRKHA